MPTFPAMLPEYCRPLGAEIDTPPLAGSAPSPPPHAAMSKARPVTDPIKRNMMIPSQVFAMGISCHSKRFGVHELCVKVGSCFPEVFGKDARSCASARPEPLL